MTPLSLDAPLASLLETARAAGLAWSQADLGACRVQPVDQGAVARTIGKGDRIKLSTLAAYARAAGYVLWLVMQERRTAKAGCQCGGEQREECNYCAGELDFDICWCHVAEERDPALNYPPAAVVESLDVTVSGARALLRALGLEMTLAVEPIEKIDG